jgi:hypothetical protein
MQGRYAFLKGGTRPQAMLWANNPGTIQQSFYVPNGVEGEDFVIVSDHNRSELSFSQNRIETRERMINGNMRSYWIADKLNISCNWSRLPSRPFDGPVSFDENGKITGSNYLSYTVDGAAGGVDMLHWYESHPEPFYLYLSYDKYKSGNSTDYSKLHTYNQIIKVYFSSFNYSVEKRSGTSKNNGFDFWSIDLSMEEA